MITTTLKDIRDNSPCTEGWETLLSHLGKFPTEAKSCTDELPVLTVLEANGMDDALWVLDNCINPAYLPVVCGGLCGTCFAYFRKGTTQTTTGPVKRLR